MKKYLNIIYILLCRPAVWVPIIVFGLFYLLYFWYTLFHRDALYGGPGDHTAGIMWLYDRSPGSPWWHFTTQSAYPFGDDLWSPLFITGQIGYVVFWLCSKLVGGSVGGYNLFTFLGFLSSFIMTYVFIYKRFLKAPLLAALLGLAVAFTPFAFAVDAVGHTSYIYLPAYFITSLWLTIRLFEQRRSLRTAVGLGAIVGATILFDPYFVLFIPLAVVSSALALLVMRYNELYDVSLKQIVRRLVVCVLGSLPVVIPVLLYLKWQSADVEAIAANTRVSGITDALQYSANPIDYLLPSVQNPFIPPFVKSVKLSTAHGSNPTYTLFLGGVLVVGVLGAIVWWATHRTASLRAQKIRILGITTLTIATVAFIFSLPPVLRVGSLSIYMPTWILATLTPTWRVFSRLYSVVQPALILAVVAWLAEYTLNKNSVVKARRVVCIGVVLALVLLIEYIPRNPFDASQFWSFSHSLPRAYTIVKNDSHIKVLAEYPMREQPYYRGSLYLTGQDYYNKSTISSYIPTSPSAYTRNALIDLDNPQTLPALHYLGADTLLVWNTNTQKKLPNGLSQLQLIDKESYSSMFGKNDTLRLYHIKTSTPTRRFVAVVQSGFRPTDESQLYNIQTSLQSGISIASVDLCIEAKRSECTDVTEPQYYKGFIYNKTRHLQTLTIKGADDGSEWKVIVEPGKNNLKIALKDTRYILSFDPKLNNKIAIMDQEIVH